MAATSLLVLFAVPFVAGVAYQLIVPVVYTLAVIVLIRLITAFIRWRFRR
jgi:hypothetical protein